MFSEGDRASLRVILELVICFGVLFRPMDAVAADEQEVPSPSNYGGAGLLDMRTARVYPDGYLTLTGSFTQPDDRYAITFQALPWAEFTFRYSITRAIFDGGVPLHDRSFDTKFRISHETEYSPELALGFQDVLGTGVYSGEYLVGSKRWGPVDLTLGLGWGRLGSRGTFENPFGLISRSFLQRQGATGFGGVPLLRSWFRGPDAGLFGGIEYQTPIPNLKFKIEYSSDRYALEKIDSNHDFGFPVNAGFSYRPYPWLDVGLSLMHGKYMGLRVSTLTDLTADNWQARLDPAPRFRARTNDAEKTLLEREPLPVAPNDGSPKTQFVDLTAQRESAANEAINNLPDAVRLPQVVTDLSQQSAAPPVPQRPQSGLGLESSVSERIAKGFLDQGLDFFGANRDGDKLVVLIENGRYRRDTEAIARAARILSAEAPRDIEYFEITLLRFGQPLSTITLPRRELDKLAQRNSSPAELFEASEISPGASAPLDHLRTDLFPQIGGFLYPVFRQSLFDPDNPVYVNFAVGGTEGLRLTRGWFVEGTVVASLYNDFNQIKRGPNSSLPNVRSDIANYLKKGSLGLENLSTSYFFKLAPEIYGRASAGYLEQMFAVVGGELLYRPFGQRWSIGADLWSVRQRDYHVLLDLRHYQSITGHVTAYYELPWHDVRLAVSAGQYLAGDKGVTFAFSRRFSTGVEVGAWFTLTNVSAAQFGEGSFDKGIRIVIPFEWVAPFATQSGYDLGLRPIQRDGGQRLNGDTVLYGVTDPSSYGALTQEWNSVFQ